MTRVLTGLERIYEGDAQAVDAVRGRKIGLVAHPASVTSNFVHARDVLLRAGADIRVLFGPEHGFGGEAQDMIGVAGAVDTVTSAPIHSLYGATEADLSPKREWLEGLDAVVVDLQDVGARYYTFVWTAALVLEAAQAAGVETIILDRPNPLGGEVVEGAPQRPGYRSFVGLYDVAVRHGMTIGEIANMVRITRGFGEKSLRVVEMKGWKRSMTWEETRLPWVLPSPNMPTPDTTRVYAGGCLLEGTNLSEGRGTTRPFEIWGAPFVDGAWLAKEIDFEGLKLRPLTFQPTFHKHAKAICGGLQVHVEDVREAATYVPYLQLIAMCFHRWPDFAKWRTEVYEYVTDRLAIDLLTGGPEFRETVESGHGLDVVFAQENAGALRFREERKPWLLYTK